MKLEKLDTGKTGRDGGRRGERRNILGHNKPEVILRIRDTVERIY